MMSGKREVTVIGGGAAGLTSAIAAARHGARVRVLERMSRVGKKILATGNGRCNLTNVSPDAASYHGAPWAFVAGILDRFGVVDTRRFFEEMGIETREEDEGRVFPLCGQASAVLDALRFECEDLGVEIEGNAKVGEIERHGERLVCRCTNDRTYEADAVVVATGGSSAPNMGSNGDGFKLAEKLGHRVVTPLPALVQVRVEGWFLKRLKGLKVEGGVVAREQEKPLRTSRGEVLFTEYGLSGPPVLHVSRTVSERLNADKGAVATVEIVVDLFPDTPENDLRAWISRRLAARPLISIERSMMGLLHKRLVPVVLRLAGIEDGQAPASSLGTEGIAALAESMKRWRMPCTGTESWMSSQVTAGGVDASEIDAQTLESGLAPGIYFAGEVIDVDGDSGGYNLQWAWSSGYVAGCAAADARS